LQSVAFPYSETKFYTYPEQQVKLELWYMY
jgi:hypothetical protein